jgi:hypothetical protein
MQDKLNNDKKNKGHKYIKVDLSESPWVKRGHTGLDLVCKYCDISFHANKGKHKKGCPYYGL